MVALVVQVGWSTYLPLVAAFISAVTAIAATKASVWFSSRRLEQNCARALRTEMSAVRDSIADAVAREKQRTYVRLPFLASPERACTVYRGAAVSLGLLEERTLASTVAFYGSVMVVKPVPVAGQETADAFTKDDLVDLMDKADRAMAAVDQAYGSLSYGNRRSLAHVRKHPE